jgi:hypothetical protein
VAPIKKRKCFKIALITKYMDLPVSNRFRSYCKDCFIKFHSCFVFASNYLYSCVFYNVSFLLRFLFPATCIHACPQGAFYNVSFLLRDENCKDGFIKLHPCFVSVSNYLYSYHKEGFKKFHSCFVMEKIGSPTKEMKSS